MLKSVHNCIILNINNLFITAENLSILNRTNHIRPLYEILQTII
jgi:hypothetical protein